MTGAGINRFSGDNMHIIKEHQSPQLAYYWRHRDQVLQKNRAYRKTASYKKAKKRWYYSEKGQLASRDYHYRRSYGLSVLELEKMNLAQNKRCAICEQVKKLVVDHSHKTQKIRGLLCDLCNRLLGYSKESIHTLKNAINYLEREAGHVG